MTNANKYLSMSADDYAECYKEVKQMETELNIKFVDDEFDKVMILLHDPSFTIEPER